MDRQLSHIKDALQEQFTLLWKGPVTSSRNGRLQLPALVCQLSGDTVLCACLQPDRVEEGSEFRTIACGDDAAEVLSSLGRRASVVAILPRSHYLIRPMEIPKVEGDQVHSALALQAEGSLPRDFGPPEVAYRPLGEAGDGMCRYEVYVSRRDQLRGYLDGLAAVGVRPDIVLPSAVVWSCALGASDADILVASSGTTGYVEAALAGRDSTVSARVLQRSGNADRADLDSKLSECIRSALAGKGADLAVLKVGWIGQGRPSSVSGDHISIKDATDDWLVPSASEETSAGCEPLPHIAARCLSTSEAGWPLDEANLLPQETVLGRRRAGVYRALAVGAVSVFAGLAILYGALEIGIARYRRLNEELSAKTALIRTEGEQAERRVSQLKAILAAQSAGRDFHEVASGLLAATPPGVSYSRVELTDTGQVRLRGQAESVSLPFLLPERLQKEPIFRQAVLQSAGQQKRGAGSTTEFLLDCTFRRKGVR